MDSSAFTSPVCIIAMVVAVLACGIAGALLHRQRSLRAYRDVVSILLSGEGDRAGWIWETNAKGELSFASPRLPASLGIDMDTLIGKDFISLSGYPPRLRSWQRFLGLMTSGESIRDVEVPVRVGTARHWWQINARPLYDGGGRLVGYRGVGRDITAARRQRNALLLAKERAERASAAKSQFLSVMSHELRTPLNAIIGFSEIVAEEKEGPIGNPSYRDYARNIVESSRNLQGIISDILDAGRIERGSFKLLEQEVDVGELTDAVIRRCRSLAKQAGLPPIAVSCKVQAEIRGDLVRLTQILTNLLTNAIKFTPRQGTIAFRVEEDAQGGIAFSIRDSGIGIEKKDLQRVFEPFFQADVGNGRQFGGTGLGLAIAKTLSEAHGGDVTLESSPGEGTTATFRVPADRVIRRPMMTESAA